MEPVRTGQSVRFDRLDARLVALLAAEPRIGMLECARRLGVARGTAQARLDRLQSRGVITGFGPDIAPAALGFEVTAFVTLEIAQGTGHRVVAAHLAAIPEVLEAHTVTGQGDLLCRIVARSNADLQRVIDAVVADADIRRTATVIALTAPVPYRILPLVRAAAEA
jgi:DNA-binding Lrp family transcriptional regulator